MSDGVPAARRRDRPVTLRGNVIVEIRRPRPDHPREASADPVVRVDELAALTAALDAGRGGIVELAGDPGSGKTRLLNELAARAAGRGLRVVRGRATELDREADLHPFAAFGVDGPAALRAALGTVDLVLLDDLHWADERSAVFLASLTRDPLAAPVLLVVAHRARQTSALLGGALAQGVESGTVTRVRLGPLTAVQAARLLGLPADSPRLAAVAPDDRGNPFHLRAAAGGEPAEHFRQLLATELTLLGDDSRAVAAAAAVLGPGHHLEVLAAVARVPWGRTCGAVDDLQRRDILRQAPGGRGPAFRHPLLRDVVYAGAERCWRDAAHRRALDALRVRGAAATELAAHVEQSLGLLCDSDLDILRAAAAERAPADPAEAVRLLRLTVRLATDEVTRARARLELARALTATGDPTGADDLLRAVLHQGGLPADLHTAVAAECGLVECLLGHYPEARAVLAAARAALPPGADTNTVRLAAREALVGLFAGADTGATARDVLEGSRRHEDRSTALTATAVLALSAALAGDMGRAALLADESADLVDATADDRLPAEPDALIVLGLTERMLARFGAAERHLRRQIAIARPAGTGGALPVALMALSMTYHAVARLDAARGAAAEAGRLAEQLGAPNMRKLATMLETAFHDWVDGGDRDRRAIRNAEAAMAIQLPRNCWFGIHAAMLLARSLEIAGEYNRCVSLVLNVGGGPDLPRIPLAIRPRCFEMLAGAASAAGDPTAAHWADRAIAAAEALGLPMHRGCALTARAHRLATQRDYHGASELYRRAADVYSSLSMVGAQVRALAFAAECANLGGEGDRAMTDVVLAKDLARQCGARALSDDMDRLSARLRAAVRRPAPVEAPAPEVDLSVLTAREREIARIAGTGKRTREIARDLSLSPRTVDVHLTHVYRKLNVSSRAALANLMARTA